MPTLYLMQGPSGSGKTAFLHRWHLDDLVVSPDAMRDMMNAFHMSLQPLRGLPAIPLWRRI